VKASTRGAARNAGLLKQMFGGLSAPDDLVRALALDGPPGHLGDIALHFFSFGGIPATAAWASAVAAGRIVLDSEDGFSVAD
jgi:methylenetetrahydrofolate reductase (NADPH)